MEYAPIKPFVYVYVLSFIYSADSYVKILKLFVLINSVSVNEYVFYLM